VRSFVAVRRVVFIFPPWIFQLLGILTHRLPQKEHSRPGLQVSHCNMNTQVWRSLGVHYSVDVTYQVHVALKQTTLSAAWSQHLFHLFSVVPATASRKSLTGVGVGVG